MMNTFSNEYAVLTINDKVTLTTYFIFLIHDFPIKTRTT